MAGAFRLPLDYAPMARAVMYELIPSPQANSDKCATPGRSIRTRSLFRYVAETPRASAMVNCTRQFRTS